MHYTAVFGRLWSREAPAFDRQRLQKPDHDWQRWAMSLTQPGFQLELPRDGQPKEHWWRWIDELENLRLNKGNTLDMALSDPALMRRPHSNTGLKKVSPHRHVVDSIALCQPGWWRGDEVTLRLGEMMGYGSPCCPAPVVACW
jgi:hypothetical protein